MKPLNILIASTFVSISLISSSFAAPKSQVARLSLVENIVSFLPAGTQKWVKAQLNRPLIPNDSLWADKKSRAELQIGGAAIRLAELSYVKILNLNKTISQFQLTSGTVNVSVYQLKKIKK